MDKCTCIECIAFIVLCKKSQYVKERRKSLVVA